jgi:hypothetical protein
VDAVYCATCGAMVTDHRAHHAEARHDRFETRLPNGTRVSLGDMGLTREVAEQRKKDQANARQVLDEQLRQSLAQNAERLAVARASLEGATHDVTRLTEEIVAANEAIGALDREIRAAERVEQDTRAAADAARQKARAKLERGPAVTVRALAGQTLTGAKAIEYTANNDAWNETTAAGEASQAVDVLRDRRQKLARSVAESVLYRAQLEESLPGRQEMVQTWERVESDLQYEETRRMAARLLNEAQST